MKLAVSSYSYAQALRAGTMTIMDVPQEAKQAGYEGVEIVSGLPGLEDPQVWVGEIKRKAVEAGVQLISYLTAADFVGQEVEAEAKRLEGELEIAHRLGASLMRHDAGWLDAEKARDDAAFEAALPRLAEGCRRVARAAAKLGITTTVENHGYFVQDSDRMRRLVEAANEPNFGWLVDIGNFLCADEDPASALKTAAPLARHAHIKDFHTRPRSDESPGEGYFPTRGGAWLKGAIVGQGDVPLKSCLAQLKQAGYDGWLSLEFEGLEECRDAVRQGRENARRLIDSIGG